MNRNCKIVYRQCDLTTKVAVQQDLGEYDRTQKSAGKHLHKAAEIILNKVRASIYVRRRSIWQQNTHESYVKQ